MMTKVSNCKIYQNTTIPDLIMERLGAHSVTVKKHLGYDKYPKWEYLVQYNETDFNLDQPPHGAGRHLLLLRP